MKLKSIALLLLGTFTLCQPLFVAQAGPAHSHTKKASGPNGGRLLTKIEPRAEFFVTAERKVQITFVDARGTAIAPDTQIVTAIAGDRAAPTKLSFVKTGNVLVSDVALPAGNDFPTVVQIKLTPESKAVVERFNLNMSVCSDCSKPEYACICGH